MVFSAVMFRRRSYKYTTLQLWNPVGVRCDRFATWGAPWPATPGFDVEPRCGWNHHSVETKKARHLAMPGF